MPTTVFFSCAVFIGFALLLPTAFTMMFADPDTYWHIATGDAIRSLGAIPKHDVFSFTAGETPWYIYSWGFDTISSYVLESYGWQGIVMFNSILIAATLAVIFASCMLRSGEWFSAILATVLSCGCLFDVSFRPHRIGLLFIALTMLLLTHVSLRRFPQRWLFALPVLMFFWVNLYGGFIFGFFLMGFFSLEFLIQKRWELLRTMIVAGSLSVLTSLINPYGINAFINLLLIPNDPSVSIIQEFRTLQLDTGNIAIIFYFLLFIGLVLLRRIPLTPAERLISCFWMGISIIFTRNLRIFAVVSAPPLALAIASQLQKSQPQRPQPLFVQRLIKKSMDLFSTHKAMSAMLVATVATSMWLFSPSASRAYGMNGFLPMPDLSPEITYLETKYPQGRFLNTYNLSGVLLFLTHGKVPVFMDGRSAIVYPIPVIKDYMAFNQESAGWEDIIKRYQLDGAIIPVGDEGYNKRFRNLKGWHLAFKGHTANIYVINK